MTGLRARTIVSGLLVSAVAVRVSAPQPPSGAYARAAEDPAATLTGSFDGWSVAGGLGGATGQELRDLPATALAWAGDLVGLPVGAAQTIGTMAVLLLALVGAVRLARAVSETDGDARADPAPGDVPWTPWIGAVLFACGPVLVSSTLASPGGAAALATLPWLVAPLVRGGTGWRTAARSAVWLAPAGLGGPWWAGAALVAGVVVVVAVVILQRADRTLALRWALLALLSSAWWLALVWWESSRVAGVAGLVPTDAVTESVRAAVGSPTWDSGWVLLAVLGPLPVAVAGLLLRVGPARVATALLLVVSAVAAGALVGGWTPWVPAPLPTDAPTTPWAPLLGLLGLAGLLAWCPVVDHVTGLLPVRADQDARGSLTVAAGAALVLVAVAGPVLAAQEPRPAQGSADADVWAGVAAWSAQAPPGRLLVAPPVAEGRESAVVARALAGRPWVGRDSLPTSGPEATAALDDLLWRLGRGFAGADTASALRRLGVSYVLVRNDLGVSADRQRPAGLVRYALEGLGASRVAVVPPASESTPEQPTLVDAGLRAPGGGVEIWALPASADGWVHDGTPVPVVGDAGAASDLAAAGLATDPVVELSAAGADGTDGAALVTDGARRRDVDQRVAVDPYGPTVTAETPRTLVPQDAAPDPTAARRLGGVATLTASSSAADLDGDLRRAGTEATAAVDGNAFTAWQSRRGSVVGQWWEIGFEERTDLSLATAQILANDFAAHRVTQVRLVADEGETEVAVPAGGVISLATVGATSRLRIQATAVEGAVGEGDSFGIAEVEVPGLEVRDQLEVSGSPTSTWVLAARTGSYANCVPAFPTGAPQEATAAASACDRGLVVDGPDAGSLRRVLSVDDPVRVTGRVWTRAADSETSSRLADRLGRPTVTATGSSVASQDLVTRPQAAVDADPATAWRPTPEDEAPRLTLTWPRPSAVTGVRLLQAEGDVSSRITRVEVSLGPDTGTGTGTGTGPVVADVGADGLVELPGTRTRQVSVTVVADSGLTSVDSVTGGVRAVPVALAEVEVLGGPRVRFDQDRAERLRCGSGPVVSVAGEPVDTAVTASARGIVEAEVLAAALCSRPTLPAGDVEVGVEASFSWVPSGLALAPADGPLGALDERTSPPAAAAPLPAGVLESGGQRDLEVGGDAPGERTLALAVPAGVGWEARGDGEVLERVEVDGWMQAWSLPPGVSRVTLDYSGTESLRAAAGLASLGWVLVLVVALVRRRQVRGGRRRAQAMVGRSTQA